MTHCVSSNKNDMLSRKSFRGTITLKLNSRFISIFIDLRMRKCFLMILLVSRSINIIQSNLRICWKNVIHKAFISGFECCTASTKACNVMSIEHIPY